MNKSVNYRDYQLTCTAVADSNGRFESTLIVARIAWPSRPRVLAIKRAKHETSQQAIDAAQQQGMKWIDDHG